MARRMRSFGPGKNNVGVFLNNCAVAGERRRKAEKKAADAAHRRWQRERERERARQAREAERAQIRREREEERQRKTQEKLDAKANAISVRLESDMKKMGLYPGKDFLVKTAKEAVKLSVTAAGAKKYFIADDEDSVARECAKEFLRDKKIVKYKKWKEYDSLVTLVAGYRPQEDVVQDEKYGQLKARIDELTEAYEAEMKRQDERSKLIGKLLKLKSMFRDELEEFAEIINANDWGRSQCEKSPEYQERIKNKADYVAQVKAQIRPIKLSEAT